MDQNATWYGGRPWPSDIVFGGDPALPTERGTAAPTFRPVHVYCGQTVVHLSNCCAIVTFVVENVVTCAFLLVQCLRLTIRGAVIFMAAVWNRAGHYIFVLFLSSYFFLFSMSNISGRTLDVYHTSTHGVALVRI